MPDLNSLWSLLCASPTYYHAFQLVKESLLHSLLHKHYAGLVNIADAIAAIRSKGLYANDKSNKEHIIALLDGRRRSDEIRQTSLSLGPLPDEPANLQETMQLLHLHNQALFFLEDYCKMARRPEWMAEARWDKAIKPLVLTDTEKRRVLRAFYRLQIYGNIFGSIERTIDAEHSLEDNDWFEKQEVFSGKEMWHMFFSTMPPWEVEEFSCLWEHCCYRYELILREVSDSLMQTGFTFFHELPKGQQPPDACYFHDCDDLEDPMDKRECLASKGPSLLCKVLRETQLLSRRNLVLVNVRSFRLHFYDLDFWPRPGAGHGEVRLLHPADKFDSFGTNRNGLIKFLKTLPPSERPNLLWEVIWLQGNYDFPEVFWDMFQYGAESQEWEWQYALWDDERLIEWNVPILSDDYPFWDPRHDN